MNHPQPMLGSRRYDLDWVRICAFLLLIFYHVGMYYVTWGWHIKSVYASNAIEPLMMITSPWRLSLLFFVSGVATAYLLQRSAPTEFLSQRSLRLLIPLLFGVAVIVPPQSYLEVVEKLNYPDSYAHFYRLYITGFHGFCREDCLFLPTWNHLWFVAYLWVYTLILYGALRLWPPLSSRLTAWAQRWLSGMGVVAWPLVVLCLARVTLAGRFPANHALLGDWYNHASYFPVFVLGYALAGVDTAWDTLERMRWQTLGFAVLGWAALSTYFGMYSSDADIPPEALRMTMRLVFGAEQWLAISAAVGFAHRHLRIDNAARRYLTAAIFPVYILHQTVIIVVAHALKPAQLNPNVEALLLVLVTVAVCFLSYEGIRRVRFLRPLFGLPAAI